MAYDQEFAAYSPGIYLLLYSLGQLCDQKHEKGIQEINFGPGDSPIKSLLNSSKTRESSVYIHAPTLQGLGLNLLFSLASLTDTSLRKILPQGSFLANTARRIRQEYAIGNLDL